MRVRTHCLFIVSVLICVSYAHAEGLKVEATEHVVVIRNETDFTIEGVRYGAESLQPLAANTSHEIPYSEGVLAGGRFAVSEWTTALKHVEEHPSRLHLMTAGIYPDVVVPGLAGDPLSSINIKKLTQYDGPLITCPVDAPSICWGLVAHASLFLPIHHLEHLLKVVTPNSDWPAYAGDYRDLPTIPDSIREAFERWGPIDIADIRVPKAWLYDRGLSSPVLLSALNITPPAGFLATRVARDFSGAHRAISSAYQNGNDEAAAAWSLEAWRLHDPKNITQDQRRLICSGFDAGAAFHQGNRRFVAAFGYLILISAHCEDTPGQRERLADWFSIQGRTAFAELRLEAARVLFERAHFFDSSPKTEAELADTLAELAILRFREGELDIARTYLDKAARIAAFRPKVLAAQEAEPGGNKQAKIGIIIIICFIAFFAARKLRRVWFGDLSGRRS